MLARFVGMLALVALLCTASTTQAAIVAHWAFENDYLDSSGNGNTLTPVNGPTFVGPVAPFGTAALNVAAASSQYATNTAPVGMGFTGPYSLAGWLNIPVTATQSDGQRPVFWRGSGAAGDIEAYVQLGSNEFIILHNRNNTGTFAFTTAPPPPDAVGFHLAVTYDGAQGRIYYNGVLQNPTAQAGNSRAMAAGPLATAGYDVNVGHAPSLAPSPFFTGAVDEFFVFNHALTEGQIGNLIEFNSLTAPSLIPEPSSCALLSLGALSLAWRRRGRGGRSPR